ncbi:EscR/YscR/HrcR family type III secretion system export apparatus protein [Aliidongia dinghuensis]|uniref:EscR/YscR/HrcR family type III secretion system export apparatus protein n=1 Tax=Aliidongia dinghuensis TaxID=1867774 RepID=A0A8J2YQ17_9PROT|nr:type III secretion system export apparatus subunit SctR [Aliidongia dinghuensis]GGF05339.1 EscR/YscR/HrcR family type III secretion system export apparatus protein [Aliidongia dinghuensis]
MDNVQSNVVTLVALGIGFGLLPLIAVTATAFLKISVVLFLVRNALGTQQTPPNLVLYSVAIALTVFVTAPLASQLYGRLAAPDLDLHSSAGWQAAVARVTPPLRDHLTRFIDPTEHDFFVGASRQVWGDTATDDMPADSLLVLIPSFVISELTRAFEIGFLLYLPFIAIDLIISNVLMAMGMTMVSPLVISVPFKLFLFVMINGWGRLLHGLVLSYR